VACGFASSRLKPPALGGGFNSTLFFILTREAVMAAKTSFDPLSPLEVFEEMRLRQTGLTTKESVEMREIALRLSRRADSASETERSRLAKRHAELCSVRKQRVLKQTQRKEEIERPHIAYKMHHLPPGRRANQVLPFCADTGAAPLCTNLTFDVGQSSFPNAPQVVQVRDGVIGWGDAGDKALTGDGGEDNAHFLWALQWHALLSVPGIYELERFPDAPDFIFVLGRHRVIASGWVRSSFDASVSVSCGITLSVVGQSFQAMSLAIGNSSDSTRSEDREKPFNLEMTLPDDVVIQTDSRADLYLTAWLATDLVVNPDDSESLALFDGDLFGIPANTMADAERIWRICRYT
jgi:hypothetical protein